MACYSCGCGRKASPFGRCCRQTVIPYNWCGACDPGVDAIFIPCLNPCTPDNGTGTGETPGTGEGTGETPGTGEGTGETPGTGEGTGEAPGTGEGTGETPGTGEGGAAEGGTEAPGADN